MSLAPIALFTFNRLEHTQRTVYALQENRLASESDLFIFADGPRHAEEALKTEELRKFLRTVGGFRSVKVIEQEQNMGLAKSIIWGVTKLVEEYDRVIVLEDDLVTDRHFLEYMNEALDLFQNDERVGCIHGYVYPLEKPMASPFFLKGADCWGWATWKRSWDSFNPDGKALLSKLKKRNLDRQFDFEGAFPFTRMLKDQTRGRNDSWAIRWTASLLLADKLCLYPNRTLVENIGLDGSGVHCHSRHSKNFLNSEVSEQPRIRFDGVEVKHSEVAYHTFKDYFRIHFPKRSLLGQIKRLLF